MNSILECRELSKSYRSFPALQRCSFTVKSGQIVGILGPNGSGKTTLMKIAAGLLTPDSGEILICGKRPGTESKSQVAYLPDKTFLNSRSTVEELIHLFSDFYGNFDADRAYTMLDSLQIDRKRRFGSLSKGTQEKIQLLLVMSRRAALYILDEPIGGVDPAARDYILQTIISNYDENAAVLISTHLISDIESILDQAVFLQNGTVVLNDSTESIREQYKKSIDSLFREVFRC